MGRVLHSDDSSRTGDQKIKIKSMELKLDKGEYTVGYARIGGGVLVLTNKRLLVERELRIFRKKSKSIFIKDIKDVKLNKGFFFGNSIEIKYMENDREDTLFMEFPVETKAKETLGMIHSLQKGEMLSPLEVPKGEVGRISLEEAEKIALDFMEKKAQDLAVIETRHVAGAWNIVLSNQDRYAVVVGDDGKLEAWKKLTKKGFSEP